MSTADYDGGRPKAVGLVRTDISGLDIARHATEIRRHADELGYRYLWTRRLPGSGAGAGAVAEADEAVGRGATRLLGAADPAAPRPGHRPHRPANVGMTAPQTHPRPVANAPSGGYSPRRKGET
jgi:hypothetical protein